MEYQQLDSVTRLNMVRSRIRDIESQYFSLDLRVNAPDQTQPPSEMDQQNLTKLGQSLDYLRSLEQQLTVPAGGAQATGGEPSE